LRASIAKHAILNGEQFYRLKDGQLVPVDLHMKPPVLDDWEHTRAGLKAAHP
jgi:hypothetical protein